MTEAVYTATAEYIVEMEQRPVKHRVSVSGVLKRLGVSRSGLYISNKLTSSHGQSDHLSRRFRSLIPERDSR